MPENMANDNLCFKYNFALVSRIANSFKDESAFDLKPGQVIDTQRARRESEGLVETLRRIGVDVIELPSDDRHPDAVFVDDIAVVINGTALICKPPTIENKPSRLGELAVVRQVLRREVGLKIVEVGSEKATLEGGDVLWTGREIFVGLSGRTNLLGAQAVAKAFPEYATTIVKVYPPAIHLKDYICMAGPNVFAVGKSTSAQKTFAEIRDAGGLGYDYISVDEDDGANVLYVNGTLIHLASEQIPRAAMVYENLMDYHRVGVELKEVRKRHGLLTNCVLLISRPKKQKKVPFTS